MNAGLTARALGFTRGEKCHFSEIIDLFQNSLLCGESLTKGSPFRPLQKDRGGGKRNIPLQPSLPMTISQTLMETGLSVPIASCIDQGISPVALRYAILVPEKKESHFSVQCVPS